MRPRHVSGRDIGHLPVEQSREGAIASAIAAIAESEQFTVIITKPGDCSPEVVGYGGVSKCMVDGLRLAHDYLVEELRGLNHAADVRQLVGLLTGQATVG